jgi:DNA-binding response OmpR family regulator
LKRNKITNPEIEQHKTQFKTANIFFDSERQLLQVGDQKYQLTTKETELMKMLFENKNKVLRRGEILLKVWGEDDYFLGRSLDVYIAKLRKYMHTCEAVKIENIHGVGFQFKEESA